MLTVLILAVALLFASATVGLYVRANRVRVQDRLGIAILVAVSEARRRGHASVLPEHFLRAALCDERVAMSLPGGAAEAERIASGLDERMQTSGDGGATASVALSDALLQAIVTASASSGRQGVPLMAVVREMATLLAVPELAMASEPPSTGGPAQVGDQASTADRSTGHVYRGTGAIPHIVLWNDSRTKMEDVVSVLKVCFGKGEAEAAYLMLRVHYDGAASVGRFPPDEAIALLARGNVELGRIQSPLRMTLERSWVGPPRGWRQRLRRRFMKAALRHVPRPAAPPSA